ncbi:hypothetical protein Tco_0693231 [Tanacetum coccineum]
MSAPRKGHGQGVVRTGKLATIVEKTKKEQAEKDYKAADELDESSDDDFVTNVGARHGPGMDKEKGLGRKKMDDDTTRSIKGLKGKGKSTDDDCGNVKRGKDVRDIGFGAFLEYKIKGVPKWLAYWLLDKFDEDTCSLNVNGRSIMITPDVVRNLLGVPMGDVHINARNETDFRNPLARQWKAQFGKAIKRHYNTHVANEIVEKGCSGLCKQGKADKSLKMMWDIMLSEEAELEVISDEEQVLEEDDITTQEFSSNAKPILLLSQLYGEIFRFITLLALSISHYARLRDVAVYYHFAISTFPVKIVIRSSAFILEYLLHLPIRLASAAIFVKMGVLQIGISAMVIENKVVTVMSSSPHSTIVPSDSDTEDAFSSMNILNYFPASPGNISPNSSDDFTKYLLDILFFPPLHDNPYVQTYDAIPPP